MGPKTWGGGSLGREVDRQTNHFNFFCVCHIQKSMKKSSSVCKILSGKAFRPELVMLELGFEG